MHRDVFRGLLLFAATLLVLWGLGLILWPFLVPVAWALCIASVTARAYDALARRLGRPRLAAGVLTVATGLVILLPLGLLIALLLAEARAVDYAAAGESLQRNLPALEGLLARLGVDVTDLGERVGKNAPELVGRLVRGPFARDALSVLFAPLVFLAFLVVTLVTQYFVYRESDRLRALVRDLSPLAPEETDRILATLRSTTSAAVLGGLIVAAVQGALGGIGWAIAGLQSPVLWSLVMTGVSFLPFGGTALVWGPAAAYLFLVGETGNGAFLCAYGILVVGSADNLLRPWVLSRIGDRGVHPLLLFFAILSGIGLFGISGIVFGPLLLALLTASVQIFREHGISRA
jgi:predicted PurR-regulated permease PerM